MDPTTPVYLNGAFVPAAEACISVLDRGFLFADSVYEVIPVYGGQPFHPDAHLDRLGRSLAALDMIDPISREQWHDVLGELARQAGNGDAMIYLQVTRGVAEIRDHAPPGGMTPTVFAMAKPFQAMAPEVRARGLSAITLEDIRWRRCDVKTTALLANVLARKQAAAVGADEAILIRDGFVTEGAASNVFIVMEGRVVTPPKTHDLLAGITRDVILELASGSGIPFAESAVSGEDLRQADEIWLSSSSKEVLPVVTLDGHAVGSGGSGPVWRQMSDLFTAHTHRLRQSA